MRLLMSTSWARYFHTLRHLRPEQVYGRLWFRWYRPAAETEPAPPSRTVSGRWVQPARRRPSLVGPERFKFLNEERDVAGISAWDDAGCAALWRYNLHYFDDLNADGAEGRNVWHETLIDRWIRENPPGWGTGWEPYPTSLRIVNWIKWGLSGHRLGNLWQHSLAIQTRWLMRRLEWHLLGNHLFANAKALVSAGCFFEGAEADRWLARGFSILAREMPQQILPDGGQFERSPMYHALAVEDVLDLINLLRVFPNAVPARWCGLASGLPELAMRMRHWLAMMCHPDGEIAFFNDAAIGVAPSPTELGGYAERLGFARVATRPDAVTHLAESGYLRVQRAGMVALLDVAPIGPDYLPGHAHADTLSFELSLFGQRVLVNSGTSCYGAAPERQCQRGTAAHNTVTLDDADSSEVWGGFRVARRARPFGLEIEERDDLVRVRCAHDGYRRLPGQPIHRREWLFEANALTVRDFIENRRCGKAVVRFHLHPGATGDSANGGGIVFGNGRRVRWITQGGHPRWVPGTYHPEFGLAQPSSCLEIVFAGDCCATRFEWN